MNRKIKYLLLILFLLLFLSSCKKQNDNSINSDDLHVLENCVPSIMNYSIPISSYVEDTEDSVELPGNPWQNNGQVPYESETKNDRRELILSGIDSSDGKNEIWVLEKYYPNKSDWYSKIYRYYIYTELNDEWSKISATIDGEESVVDNPNFISRLFITNTGNVWGLPEYINPEFSNTALSYFDKDKRTFIEDEKSKKLVELISVKNSGYKNEIEFDPKGYLWIFSNNDGVYRYDLESGDLVQKIFLGKGRIYSARRTEDEKIYYLLGTVDESLGLISGKLIEYDNESGEIQEISVPQEVSGEDNFIPYNFIIDKHGRIWIGNTLYRESNGQWYRVLEKPIFITDNLIKENQDRQYNVDKLLPLNATSDGNIWLIGSEGTFRTNPDVGDWCWVSTEQSIVLEDGNGYLWMVAGNNLYKRPLGEIDN